MNEFSPRETADGQRLNAADETLLHLDRSFRQLRSSGFEVQTFVWLAGRVDTPRLQAALVGLGTQYPITTARLVEGAAAGGPRWRYRPGASCALVESVMESEAPQAVLDHAGRLLSTVMDPTEADPIRFHLLHRPDGRDVFLLQFNHALMDHGDIVRVLRYLDHFTGAASSVERDRGDLIRAYLRRFPRQRRRQAMHRVREHVQALHGGAIHLGRATKDAGQGPVEMRILTRSLDADQTQALQAHLQSACGVPSLSMAILASAFRTVGQLNPERGKRAKYFHTAFGVDLGLYRDAMPLLQNQTSVVPLVVAPEEVTDRLPLIRLLNRRVRELLSADMDMGVAALSSVFTHRPQHAQWATDLLMRYCVSFEYGYMGSLDAAGEQFCGATTEVIHSAGPSWAPMGMTLLANQYHGRLLFQATYTPEVVPEALANRFLDLVLEDLKPQ